MSRILTIIMRTTFIWILDTSRFTLLTWGIRKMRTSSSDTLWTTLSFQRSLLTSLLKSRQSNTIVKMIGKILCYGRPHARSNNNYYTQNDNLLQSDKLCLGSKKNLWRGREDFRNSAVSIIFRLWYVATKKLVLSWDKKSRTPLSWISKSFRSSRHVLEIWETTCSDKAEYSRMIDKSYYHNAFTKSIYDDNTKERHRSTAPFPKKNWTCTQCVSKVFRFDQRV